jgi:hypothetical protein
MYINFHKFNYDIVESDKKADYEARDKAAYVEVLGSWFEENKEEFAVRKWEIEEIHYLKEIDAFINLVRESESLYELGFYTGCIALVGVSAEDFSKYLSLKGNRQEHITNTNGRGNTHNVSQFNRLMLQRNEKLIDQVAYELLDNIRKIRNNCLHYNQEFKQKDQSQLKHDAITVLNNLKQVLKNIIGTGIKPSDFMELSKELMKQMNTRSFEEILWKQKNMFSYLLNFSTTQDPDVKRVKKCNIFKVLGIEGNEIDLQEIETIYGTNLIVVVDIDEKGKNLLDSKSVQVGDFIFAEVYSNVAYDGQTREWFISALEKVGRNT